jgi:uncharacterized iron-regulated membrane protein
MKLVRRVIFWVHLSAGLTGGIVIFIMAVTGAMLSFEKNITQFFERDQRYVAVPAAGQRLGIQEVLDKFRQVRPGAKPGSISISSRPDLAYTVTLGREGQVFIDPYTGAVLGEGAQRIRGFFRSVEDLHRFLALPGAGRPIGRAISGASNLLFLFLSLSGLYLWFPRQRGWKQVRPVIWFRRGVQGRARNFNWHNVFGSWCSLVLVVLTVTGAVMSYQWAGNLLYTLTGNEVPRASGPGEPEGPRGLGGDRAFVWPEHLDAPWAVAETISPGWRSISLRLPLGRDGAVFTIDEGKSWNSFGRSMLTVDPETAKVTKWEPYGEQNAGRRLRSWFRFTHTGETGGVLGQFVGFVPCIGGAFLVFTGISLAVRRFGRWRKKLANPAEAYPDQTPVRMP